MALTQAGDATVQWLLEIGRWQVLRDLARASEKTIERERCKVSRDGWGARLLARQDPGGAWASGKSSDGGLYSLKWTSATFYDALASRPRPIAAHSSGAQGM